MTQPPRPTAELPKAYDPHAVEAEAYRVWTEERAFHAEPSDPGDPFAIVIPPPNVTAALHLGHALNNTIQDILTRVHRMRGDNACWLPGTDHAGIATQTVVEKRVMQEEGKRRTDFARDEFVAKIQAWKDEYEQTITAQLKAMGCSCDWDRQAFTMDAPRAKAVREAFFQLFKDGLIYRGKRLVNWDPATQTALADDEVEMEEVDGHFYYLRYPLVDDEASSVEQAFLPVSDHRSESAVEQTVSLVSDQRSASSVEQTFLSVSGQRPESPANSAPPSDPEMVRSADPTAPPPGAIDHSALSTQHSALRYIVVATTRPETMLGDTAVAMNPKDPRAAALRGKKIRLPLVNREIPIVEDDYVVLSVAHGGDPADPKAQFATGFLKVTPAHDPNDYEIGRRHNLATINVMAPDASISAQHGWPADDAAGADPFLAASLLGQSREEARKRIVQWFKENGLLEEVKPYRHSVGHSYRSHIPIEPYLSDQWYCKVTADPLAGAALRAMSPDQREAKSTVGSAPRTDSPSDGAETVHSADTTNWAGQLRFYPSRYAKTFQTWHENIRDWCISRQLWWGHRIPVWAKTVRIDETLGLDQTLERYAASPMESLLRLGVALVQEWKAEEGGSNPGPIAVAGGWQFAEGPGEQYVTAFCCVGPDDAAKEQWLEASGFTRDPDVLDTWFSSALWPLSTLHWPDENPALEKWNPSNVLTTAREIITLWVSRMVMFNLYFRDRLPFYDVFIHAMIQDGEGQKMSKSLGNGVDPLDIIASHGADAMRYTLAAMTTHTQDLRMPVDLVDPHSGQAFAPAKITTSAGYVVAAPVQQSPKDPKKKLVSSYGVISGAAKATAEMPLAKNTSSKFDLGRNFCNKIWNAVRFALMNLKDVPPVEPDEAQWSLADRWIVSRFNRTVAECDAAIAEYRFDVYAKSCYDFFWRDLCDWYLEAIKPAMKETGPGGRAAQTAAVLASVLDGALRLLHPVIPFITETIWWRLNDARPRRGLPGRIDCPPSERLVKAPWPTVGDFAEAAEFLFPKIQEIVAAIRQMRNDYKVDPKKSVAVSVLTSGDAARTLEASRELVETLAVCTLKAVAGDLQPPPNAARALAVGCEVFVEGLVDEDAEKARAGKKIEELQRQIASWGGQLAKESYVSKAPPHLVQQTRDRLAAAESELAKLLGQ